MIHSNRQARKQLEVIILNGVDLTEWEWDFIDSVTCGQIFSLKQREVIDRIYTIRVPSQYKIKF